MLTIYGVRPTIVKDALEAPGDLAFDRWNSFSRIAVGQSYAGQAAMWGPSPRFPVPTVEQRWLTIDGSAGTGMRP